MRSGAQTFTLVDSWYVELGSAAVPVESLETVHFGFVFHGFLLFWALLAQISKFRGLYLREALRSGAQTFAQVGP